MPAGRRQQRQDVGRGDVGNAEPTAARSGRRRRSSTPWLERSNAALTAMPSTSASSPPGTRGAKRSTPNSSTSAPRPTANVAQLVSPRCASRWTNWRIVSPSPFSIPNSFGSWLTVTKIASPKTKPSITGRERNCATKPSRRSPASRNRPPQNSTSAAPSAAYSAALAGPTVGDRRGEQHGRRGGRADDEVPARAEARVGGERREQRVEPGLRRKPGEPGVGDRSPERAAPRSSRRRSRRSAGSAGRTPAATRGSARSGAARRAAAPPTRGDRHVPSADRNRRAQRWA